MKLDFVEFKTAVRKRFGELSKHDMFRVDLSKDDLWNCYIGSFPSGTNPIFRERTEHDCSCCRQFIRAVGNAVAIVDGEVLSLWDVKMGQHPYQVVADAMAELIKSRDICDVFLHYEKSVGTDRNFEDDDGKVITWEHFHADIPWARNEGRNYFCPKKDLATVLGDKRAHHDVLLRGLTELTQDAVDTVLDIIGQGSLYRGNEYERNVKEFAALKRAFDRLETDRERAIFAWSNFDKVPGSVSKIRNIAIGTLLIDLSAGIDLEDAVRKFETSIMAPSNYKRPTALVSQKMVDAARKAVDGLGLTSALERRYARLDDISVNDVIFADRASRMAMKGGAFDGVANKPASVKNLDKIEAVPIDKFISEIVPHVDSIEVFVENKHAGNLVSLVAPIDKAAKPFFKWDNGFSWSYNGDVADSLKERVKRAGGNVTGDLCCRLAWHNYDDLDLHMKEPGGFEIYFRDKHSHHTGGQLDVDMNAGRGTTRQPVENIFYGNRRKMREGIYELFVHQWAKREADDVGFEIEIDYLGEVRQYAYDKTVRPGEKIIVAKFEYRHDGGIKIIESLPEASASKTIWGLKTQGFHKVNALMLSPNHWDGNRVGNKHYFFMLADCVNDGSARGFFNEFLRPELDKHRKVIEIVGSKMKVKDAVDQLSGLGFADTRRAELLVRVKGTFTRQLKVMI